MDSISGLFAGILVGFFIVSIFKPPRRKIPSLPTPGDLGSFTTPTGCVKINAEEVTCTRSAVSLNVLVNARKASKT